MVVGRDLGMGVVCEQLNRQDLRKMGTQLEVHSRTGSPRLHEGLAYQHRNQ